MCLARWADPVRALKALLAVDPDAEPVQGVDSYRREAQDGADDRAE